MKTTSRLGHLGFAIYVFSFILPAAEIAHDKFIGALVAVLSLLGVIFGITSGLEPGQLPACVLVISAHVLMLYGYFRYCFRKSFRKWRPSCRLTTAILGFGAICTIGAAAFLATGSERFVPHVGYYLWVLSMILLSFASWQSTPRNQPGKNASRNNDPEVDDDIFRGSKATSLRTSRMPWLFGGLIIATAAIGIWSSLSGERRDIRFQAAGEWSRAPETKFIMEPAPGRYVSVSVGAGFTNNGNWFHIVGSTLQLGSSPTAPSETVLTLPPELLNSRSWGVIESADGQRIICVNERGLAVWRAAGPQNLMFLWTTSTEAMAGDKAGTDHYGDIPYDRNELVLSYNPSPDGRLVCVRAVEQRAFRSGHPMSDGIVILRDLESGEEIARLIHKGSGAEIQRIAWSGDSRRLATFARKTEQVTVWDVTQPEPIGHISEFAEQLALSADGSLLYTVFTGNTTTGTVGPDRPRTVVHRVDDGSRVASRKAACSRLVLSPDGRYLAASTRESIELMDSSTLESIWSSPGMGSCSQVRFSPNGAELVAVSNNISGLVAAARVKAWKVADGTVLLDMPTDAASGSTFGAGFGNDGSIWTYGPSNWSRFKPIGKP
jgi:WD40 repeat protein